MGSVHGVYLSFHLHGLGDIAQAVMMMNMLFFPLRIRTSSLLFVLDLAGVMMPCLLKALSLMVVVSPSAWLSTAGTPDFCTIFEKISF